MDICIISQSFNYYLYYQINNNLLEDYGLYDLKINLFYGLIKYL